MYIKIKIKKANKQMAHLHQKLTEISNSGVARFNLIGNSENRRNLNERGRHDLTVKYRFPKVPGGLRPRDPPLQLRLLIGPARPGRHFSQNSTQNLRVQTLPFLEN